VRVIKTSKIRWGLDNPEPQVADGRAPHTKEADAPRKKDSIPGLPLLDRILRNHSDPLGPGEAEKHQDLLLSLANLTYCNLCRASFHQIVFDLHNVRSTVIGAIPFSFICYWIFVLQCLSTLRIRFPRLCWWTCYFKPELVEYDTLKESPQVAYKTQN
jgi:hypothetical protein